VPSGADLELFKKAKGQMGIDYLVQPVRGVHGSPGRIIALREEPNWICDYAFVKAPNLESIKAAMTWALGEGDDPRATTVLKTLKDIFGKGVREIAAGD
jgi:hypothetical protein